MATSSGTSDQENYVHINVSHIVFVILFCITKCLKSQIAVKKSKEA